MTDSTEKAGAAAPAPSAGKETGKRRHVVAALSDGQKKLEEVQKELMRRGVTELRLIWVPDLKQLVPYKVEGEVAKVLEDYLNGKVLALHSVRGVKEEAHSLDVLCDWIEGFGEKPTGHFTSEDACRDFIRQLRRYVELEGYVGSIGNAQQQNGDQGPGGTAA